MANNLDTIAKTMPKLKLDMGDEWKNQKKLSILKLMLKYVDDCWRVLTNHLHATSKNNHALNKKQRHLYKDAFKMFNNHLTSVHKVQTRWLITNVKLRNEFQNAVEKAVLDPYDAFVKEACLHNFSKKNEDKYIQYTRDSIQKMIGELFQGANRD